MLTSYKDSEGLWHWPNAKVGDETERYIDFDDWIADEDDTLVSLTWVVPSGVTEMTTREVGGRAIIKVSADSTGTYEFKCTASTIDGAVTQKKVERAFLTIM